jgi:hypothetical protein
MLIRRAAEFSICLLTSGPDENPFLIIVERELSKREQIRY